MFGGVRAFRVGYTMAVGLVALLAVGGEGIAQEAPSADPSALPRERELRDQLKTILQELDELQQKKDSTKPEAERQPIIKEKKVESPSAEAEMVTPTETQPDFDLSDMSIVSKRLQKRPEGARFPRRFLLKQSRSRPEP